MVLTNEQELEGDHIKFNNMDSLQYYNISMCKHEDRNMTSGCHCSGHLPCESYCIRFQHHPKDTVRQAWIKQLARLTCLHVALSFYLFVPSFSLAFYPSSHPAPLFPAMPAAPVAMTWLL